MRETILDELSLFLLQKGFIVKTLKSAFDIVARDNERIILLKVLEDANSISPEYAEQMKKVSSCLHTTLLVIANKAGELLQNNVVYSRFGIYTVNFSTFRRCVDNNLPMLKKSKAGLTARINAVRLRLERLNLGLSINELSKRIGVSKRMVQSYEKGDSDITLGRANKVYNIFGGNVFQKENLLNAKDSPYEKGSSIFARKYGRLGFDATETSKVPFDLIARKEKEVILTKVGDKPNPIISHFSKLIDADRLAIFDKKKPKGIPALTKKEFLEFDEAAELIKFIKEFEEEHED
ncbi:MAG: helix-turn-helix domain-containing protein [Candidatus Woesearchaeota archaeon]|nr:helix-turn-helix domain-containing protein [Candidatus Woesearchaeota archaeon]